MSLALLLSAACTARGDADPSPRAAGHPGLHVSFDATLGAGGLYRFAIRYANGVVQTFELPAPPWKARLEMSLPYAAGAASGAATVQFLVHPEPCAPEGTTVDVDVATRTELRLTLCNDPDAGP